MRTEFVRLNPAQTKSVKRYELYCWMGLLLSYFILASIAFGFDQATLYFNHSSLAKIILGITGITIISGGFVFLPGTWLQVFNHKRRQVLYAAGWSGAFPYKILNVPK